METMKNLSASYKMYDNEIRVVKEKFKNLKMELRVWNKEVLETLIYRSKNKVTLNMRNFDRIDENCGLDQQWIVERRGLLAKLRQIYYEQWAWGHVETKG